jgi:hypothetical protein
MVPVVPVPQPVVDDPGPDGLVVAFPQVIEQSRVQAGAAAGAGLVHGLVRLAQDCDHVGGRGLQAARAELRDGAAAADDVGAVLLDAGQPRGPAERRASEPGNSGAGRGDSRETGWSI